MICKCYFNESCDIHEVDQFGFVDVVDCYRNGNVPSQIADTDETYNDIEDPASILGKPSDVFEAYQLSDYIKKNGKEKDK